MLSTILTPLGGLLTALGAVTALYLFMWWTAITRARPVETALEIGTGFVTNFFDTLGIGSFAPTTSIFKFFKLVPDRLIPGTLNVGHTLPTIAQAFIFTAAIDVDPWTLISMIAAAVGGALLGARLVARWPRRAVQIGMGCALIFMAALFAYKNLPAITGQPNLLSGLDVGTRDLQGSKLVLGLGGNFALGALMTLGIGLYAPCMILVALLGMNPKAAFPIMMGSCAFLMPAASHTFVRQQAYERRPAVALAIGGVPAVLIAALIVREMDLTTMRWLVVAVATIAAVMMLKSAAASRAAAP